MGCFEKGRGNRRSIVQVQVAASADGEVSGALKVGQHAAAQVPRLDARRRRKRVREGADNETVQSEMKG
jgi:hypothetical protein